MRELGVWEGEEEEEEEEEETHAKLHAFSLDFN